MLSINYAEEMSQLDTVGGELEGSVWHACCLNETESVKREAVC